MEEIIFTVVEYNFGVIVLLMTIKVVHFFFIMEIRKRTFAKFIFFSDSNMYHTKDPKKKRQKRIQNWLSVIIALLLVSQVFVFMSTVFFKHTFES